jgi:hypothetical protein
MPQRVVINRASLLRASASLLNVLLDVDSMRAFCYITWVDLSGLADMSSISIDHGRPV